MKKIIFFLILLISFSCKQNRVPKPNKMISEEEMKSIMYDLAILNAAKSSDTQILEENKIIPTEFLYNKYGIDSIQFAQNSIYYAAHPEKYKQIIDAVDKRLKKERETISGEKDSLEDNFPDKLRELEIQE